MLLKLDLFLNGLATVAMLMVVTVVILRVIATYANLNFFGWTYVTLRRLADPLITPVRLALMGFRVDPKFAPLVTILITLLLWWVLTEAIDGVFGMAAGVISGIERHEPVRVIGFILLGLLRLYSLILFLRIVFSWITVSRSNKVMRFLYKTTEPLLSPLRRSIRPVGMFDVSALVAFVIIWVIQFVVQAVFLH
jgi:YggT family protein